MAGDRRDSCHTNLTAKPEIVETRHRCCRFSGRSIRVMRRHAIETNADRASIRAALQLIVLFMSRHQPNALVRACLGLCVFGFAAGGPAVLAQYSSVAEHPDIAYSKSAPTDALARLQASIEKGEAVLDFDAETGYLKSVLRALNVPVSSQSLVFSRTS